MESAHRMSPAKTVTSVSPANDVVRLRDVHLRRGTRVVLAGVNADIARGEVVALMGPSGSGKTTILRAIAGLEPFESGTIEVDGVVLASGTRSGTAIRMLAARSGWCSSSTVSSSTWPRSRTSGWRLFTRTTRRERRPSGDAMDLLRTLGVDHRAPRAAAGAVRRRSAARRDCARAGRRSAGAAHG